MKILHQYWKVLVIVFLMVVHLIVGNAARLVLRGPSLRAFQNRWIQRLARVGLAVLGIRVSIVGEQNWREGQNYLNVSNHLSYTDILVYAAFRPMCFVSTVEVRKTPVLGQLAAAAGCVFIERRNRDNIKVEVDHVATVLKDGQNLNFFPEATSTNGEQVKEFKRPFFGAAVTAQVPVLPCVIQLAEVDGKPASKENRDYVCYYGDHDFGKHLLALAGLKHGVRVTVTVLPEIPVGPATEREQLVQAAQTAIHSNYKPIT